MEILGDEQSVLRSFKNASRGAKTFERDLGRSARGAVAASVSFRGLGRSVAFASSYFLGGAGLAFALKSSVSHAEDLEKAQRSLAVVIRKTGGNVAQTLPDIEKFAQAQADVGISAVQAERGLARASAITGSTTAGLRAYREALLISKATGKDFNMVLIAAAKANNGQTTALARYIGKIEKGTSAQKLFSDVTARYSGQAQANTTATEKLGAALTNVETTIGVALLPTINHYATALADWLGKSKNQERIQRDVNTVVRDAAGIFRTLAGAVKTTTDAVGGFKNLIELLLAFKITSWALGIGRSFGLIGAQATVANGEVVALRASLLGISGMAIAPIVIPLLIDETIHGKKGLLSRAATAGSNAVSGALGVKTSDNGQGPTYQQYVKAAKHHDANFKNIQGYMKRAGITDPRRLPGGPLFAGSSANPGSGQHHTTQGRPFQHTTAPTTTTPGSGGGSGGGSLDRRSQIENAAQQARTAMASGDKGAKAKLVAALKEQIDFDKKYAAIQANLAARGGKDAKKHSDTMRQLLADEASAYDEIGSLTEKAAAGAKKVAKKTTKKKAVAKVVAKAVEFALPFKDQLAEAKAGATHDDKSLHNVLLKEQKFVKHWIATHKKAGQALIDAWGELGRINDQLSQDTNKATQHAIQTSSKVLTAGLNLSKAQRLALESRYSQALAHGGAAPTGVGALGQNVTIHVNGAGDPETVARKVAEHLTKKAKRNSGQTRGTRAGSYLGHH